MSIILYILLSSFELKPIGREIENTVKGTYTENHAILDT